MLFIYTYCCYSNNDAFKLDTMKDGIYYVSNLFKNTDFKVGFDFAGYVGALWNF